MKNLVEQWHQATGDVVRVVRARMMQLAQDGSAGEFRLLDHPDLAALDLALDNWYGDGDGTPGPSPG